ncbi:MAG: hypothetical protein Fur0025_33490 [Oscillatoriaceae cyanobacterium]
MPSFGKTRQLTIGDFAEFVPPEMIIWILPRDTSNDPEDELTEPESLSRSCYRSVASRIRTD